MRKVFALIFIFCASSLWAQNEPRVQEGQFTFDTDKPFTLLELDEAVEEPIAIKKKKPRKKVFYGIKTKKGFTRRGYGDNVTLELFYYLKNPEPANTFARDIYWYDYERKVIQKTSRFDPSRGVLLHGPYKRMIGNVVVEEGIYYKGTKHGRWMAYDREDILVDKAKYYKGWPKESLVTYYDPIERKKIKEIVPVEFSEREGYYYMFHESGEMAVVGEYKFDKKVGEWVEYYPNGTRKKLISYPAEPFDPEFKPFIKREWTDQGREVYSRN